MLVKPSLPDLHRLPPMPLLRVQARQVRYLPALAGVFVLAVLFGGMEKARAADLEVVVTNIRIATGFVRLGLYDNPKLFPKRRGTIGGGDVKVNGNTATYTFRNLKPGAYAVAIYHDANSNRRFDKTLGIPAEGFAFSNNARPRLSAPSFKRAAVTVTAPRTRITIRLLHW